MNWWRKSELLEKCTFKLFNDYVTSCKNYLAVPTEFPWCSQKWPCEHQTANRTTSLLHSLLEGRSSPGNNCSWMVAILDLYRRLRLKCTTIWNLKNNKKYGKFCSVNRDHCKFKSFQKNLLVELHNFWKNLSIISIITNSAIEQWWTCIV